MELAYKQHNYIHKLIGQQVYLKQVIDVNYLFYMEVECEEPFNLQFKCNLDEYLYNMYDYFYNNQFTFIKNVKYTEDKEVYFFDDEKNGMHFYIVILYKNVDVPCFLRFNKTK